MGGVWMGLPFWYAACLCATVFAAIFFVKRPPTIGSVDEHPEDNLDASPRGDGRYRDTP